MVIEDLKHRLDYVLAERERLTAVAKARLDGQLNLRGAASGSGAMLAKENLAREQLDETIPILVADVDRARQVGLLEAELRPLLDDAVQKAMSILRSRFIERPNPAFGGSAYGARAEFLDELEERARSQVRQYWAGYLSPNAPPGSYTLNVTASPGAAVQFGGSGNVQTVTNSPINIAAAETAAALLARELSALPASEARLDAQADLASLQRHLGRSEPQSGLIKEIGKSLRTTISKGIGGFASKSGEAAAGALWEALDL